MIAVVQRVKKASVEINAKLHNSINNGLVVFLGIHTHDTQIDAEYLSKKIFQLRIFPDKNNKMNISLQDSGASILVISQFTLYGNCSKGNRPSFINSASAKEAQPLYKFFVSKLKEFNINVQTGKFGEMMDIKLINNGPVTLIMESKNEKN